ncbi:MAG: DNA-binding protein [Planctomycetia bacterium]|nr:DNA-binding protein [Planctomycetia bacterium]
MDIALHLTEEQTQRANELAASLGMDASEFVRAALVDVLNGPSEQVKESVQRILREDAELYRRLA